MKHEQFIHQGQDDEKQEIFNNEIVRLMVVKACKNILEPLTFYCLLVGNTGRVQLGFYQFYCGLTNLFRFCTCGTRWPITNFLSMALWVTWPRRKHYGCYTEHIMDHYMTAIFFKLLKQNKSQRIITTCVGGSAHLLDSRCRTLIITMFSNCRHTITMIITTCLPFCISWDVASMA